VLYRLVKTKYKESPFDPTGAKRYGGRWNSKGVPVVYAADSPALAALELLVHLHEEQILEAYTLCTAECPEDQIMTLDIRDLPDDWGSDPAPTSTAIIGDQWVSEGASLALAVPSTVISQQSNFLINPNDPGFDKLLKSAKTVPFEFDGRLINSPR